MTTEAMAPPSTKSQVLRSYDVADFPALSGLEEEWRFTPLKRLRELVTATSGTGKAVGVEYANLPEGVTARQVDAAAVERVLVPFDRVSALAYGAATDVTLIEVAGDAVPDTPALVRITGQGTDAASYARTFVKVGRFAQAVLVIEQLGSATLADNVEVTVADGAQLTLVTIANWADDAVQAQHVKLRVGRDAKLTHIQVALGGDLVRQFTSVEYTGRGGDVELFGLYFADAGQHFEHRQLVDHTEPDCRSYVGYRGALQGR
jgi:Fe-S cluster assembly protein SufD